MLAPRIIVGQTVDGPGGDIASFVYRVKNEDEARALSGKAAPPELEAQQFRLIADGIDTFDAEKATRLYARFCTQWDLSLPDARYSSGLGIAFQSGFFQ